MLHSLIFILGALQFSAVLFLSKYFDFIGYPFYTLLAITLCQMLSLWGNLWTVRLQKCLPILPAITALAWLALSSVNENSWFSFSLLCAFVALCSQQVQLYYFLQLSEKPHYTLPQRYATELFGAAAGCLLWYFLSATIGFKGFVIFAIGFQILFSLLCFVKTVRPLAILPALCIFFVSEPQPILNKRERFELVKSGKLLQTAWDPDAHVDLIRLGHNGQMMLIFDGGQLRSHLPEFRGDLPTVTEKYLRSETHEVWGLDVVLPHRLMHQKSYRRAALISAVGGQEVLAARAFGAEKIWAIDINGSAQKIAAAERLRQGQLLFDQSVQIVHMDGRKFIERSSDKFDVIQIYSAHNASYSGTFGAYLQPGSLATKEALTEYILKLTDNGILHVGLPFYLKIRSGFDSLDILPAEEIPKHLLAIRRKSVSYENDSINNIYFKKQPWTQSEISELIAWLSADSGVEWEILHNPLWSWSQQLGQKLKILATLPAQAEPLRAATDDWPFTRLTVPPLQLRQIQIGIVLTFLIVLLSAVTLYFKRTSGSRITQELSLSLALGITYAFAQNLLIIYLQKILTTPAAGLAAAYFVSLLLSAAAALCFQSEKKWMLWLFAIGAATLALLRFLANLEFHISLVLIALSLCLILQSSFFAALLTSFKSQLPTLFWMNGLGFVLGFLLHNINFVYFGLNTSVTVLGCLYLSTVVAWWMVRSSASTD